MNMGERWHMSQVPSGSGHINTCHMLGGDWMSVIEVACWVVISPYWEFRRDVSWKSLISRYTRQPCYVPDTSVFTMWLAMIACQNYEVASQADHELINYHCFVKVFNYKEICWIFDILYWSNIILVYWHIGGFTHISTY